MGASSSKTKDKLNNNDSKNTLFKQLISYFNSEKIIEKIVSTGNIHSKHKENNQNDNINNIIQNRFCLIDKKWIKEWKNYIGYEEINNYFKNNHFKRKLNQEDYNWIMKIIEKNIKNKKMI